MASLSKPVAGGAGARSDKLSLWNEQVEGRIVSQIGPGLLCFIGVKDTDTAKDQDFMYATNSCIIACSCSAHCTVRLLASIPQEQAVIEFQDLAKP